MPRLLNRHVKATALPTGPDGPELSLTDHLRELRRRVLVCVIAILAGSVVSFAFYKQIIEYLSRPAYNLDSGSGLDLVFIEVTELLTTAVKVSFVAGFVLALPVILYQVVMFVAPGLTGRERRYVYLFMPAALFAFAAGVAFAYFVLTPPALKFLLGFSDVATPLIRISNFVNLMVRLLFWMGVAFETPLVMYMLAQLGIVTAQQLSRFAPVLGRCRLHLGGDHHPDLRSGKPGPGGRSFAGALRAWRVAGEGRWTKPPQG